MTSGIKYLLAFALVGGAAAACVVFADFVNTRHRARAPRVASVELAQSESERGHAARTLRRTSAVPVAEETPQAVAADADAPRRPAPDTGETGVTPSQGERMDYADAVFESQAFDRAWAHAARDEAESHMRAIGMPGTAACRESMCRIDFSENDEELARRRVDEFTALGKWNVMVTHTRAPNGPTRVKLYLTPYGVDLPEPDLVAATN